MKTILIAALTADGFIARHDTHAADWTGPADKKMFVQLTKAMGVMVMGSRTFATIGRALPGRRSIVYTTHPESITAQGIETTTETPAQLIARLEHEGASGVAICGGAQIYTQFMKAGVVDEVYLMQIATLFGTGVPLFNETLHQTLRLLEAKSLDDVTALLHYAVVK